MFPGAPVPRAKKSITSRHPPSVNSLDVSGVVWRRNKLRPVTQPDDEVESGTETTGLTACKAVKNVKALIVLARM